MADILDVAGTNQNSSSQPMDQNAPVVPPINDTPPPEPPPEPLAPQVDTITEPPTPPVSDNLVVPPPDVVNTLEQPKEETPPVGMTTNGSKPKKRKNPAVLMTILLFLLLTLPLTVYFVSQQSQIADIRSLAGKYNSFSQGGKWNTNEGCKGSGCVDGPKVGPGGTYLAPEAPAAGSTTKAPVVTLKPGVTVFPSSNIPGISTTGTANTQTTTFTGSHACDVVASGCSDAVKSVTVTQNYANGTISYSVIYQDPDTGLGTKAVTTTVKGTLQTDGTLKDPTVLKQETLQGGQTTTDYVANPMEGKPCVGSFEGPKGGWTVATDCGGSAICVGASRTEQGKCTTVGPLPPVNFTQPNISSFNVTTPAAGGGGGGGSTPGGGTSGGGGDDPNNPTNPPPQCISLIAYKDGNALTTAELANLNVGDVIALAFAPGGASTKVRFRVNSTSDTDWHETTNKNANSQFIWDYTLANTTSFNIEAQWFDGTSWH